MFSGVGGVAVGAGRWVGRGGAGAGPGARPGPGRGRARYGARPGQGRGRARGRRRAGRVSVWGSGVCRILGCGPGTRCYEARALGPAPWGVPPGRVSGRFSWRVSRRAVAWGSGGRRALGRGEGPGWGCWVRAQPIGIDGPRRASSVPGSGWFLGYCFAEVHRWCTSAGLSVKTGRRGPGSRVTHYSSYQPPVRNIRHGFLIVSDLQTDGPPPRWRSAGPFVKTVGWRDAGIVAAGAEPDERAVVAAGAGPGERVVVTSGPSDASGRSTWSRRGATLSRAPTVWLAPCGAAGGAASRNAGRSRWPGRARDGRAFAVFRPSARRTGVRGGQAARGAGVKRSSS